MSCRKVVELSVDIRTVWRWVSCWDGVVTGWGVRVKLAAVASSGVRPEGSSTRVVELRVLAASRHSKKEK